jgi:hypothetical protein
MRGKLQKAAFIGVMCYLMAVSSSVAAQGSMAPLYPDITPKRTCESLVNLSLPNTEIISAVEIFDFLQMSQTLGSAYWIMLPERYCHVTLKVTHSNASNKVVIWIAVPMSGWNGRFYGTTGGGFLVGSPANIPPALAEGFAAGATNGGHAYGGSGGGGDGSFALGPDSQLDWNAIDDFGYRGIHEMTVAGKAVVQALYDRPPGKSYIAGESSGGRQALTEVQRYPLDYDGVVVFSPSINLSRSVPSRLWPEMVMIWSKHAVSSAKLDAVTDAVITACDSIDGVRDNIVVDPGRCTFDVATLVGTHMGEETFTKSDAAIVHKIWQGPRASDGSVLWYGIDKTASMRRVADNEGTLETLRPDLAACRT